MNFKTVLWILALLGFLGLVGQMDYEDEILAEQQYIRDVCNGVYPDYEYLQPDCKGIVR